MTKKSANYLERHRDLGLVFSSIKNYHEFYVSCKERAPKLYHLVLKVLNISWVRNE